MGGAGGQPPTCDASLGPTEDACVIDEAFGVFVSPAGDDENEGSREAPVRTLAHAAALAHQSNKRVYACADGGDYAESLTIDAGLDGLELYGGLSCADWTLSESRATIASLASTALVVDGLTEGLLIEDFRIISSDASAADTAQAESSLAVIVTSSQSVVLRRVDVTSGAGAPGVAGDAGADGSAGAEAIAQPETAGKPADCSAEAADDQTGGGWPASSNLCGSVGGTGGQAFKSGLLEGNSGSDGGPKTNLIQTEGVDNGGPGATVPGTSGSPGNGGQSGTRGASGGVAAALGTFTAESYVPASGHDGTSGFPGQGGGGGGASMGNGTCLGASGGAGGMGGCSGGGGKAGGGGGASVALLSFDSSVTLIGCTLTSGPGGDGGNGGQGGSAGLGRPGAEGGQGDANNGIGNGGRGGDGGNGGPGGSGSGGTGGPSFALVVSGTAPMLTDSELHPGSGGLAGLGGTRGTEAAPNGSPGTSGETYEVE